MSESRAHPDLIDRLRARRWRITPQRRAVAHALAGDNVHLTAEQVFAGARAVVPEISLATVYNTLRELTAMGEVTEVAAGAGAVRYDPNAGRPHEHLACAGCGELVDVHPLGEPDLAPEDDHGYAITSVSITFHGYCPSCTGVRAGAST